jgi:molecular chaperone DnaK
MHIGIDLGSAYTLTSYVNAAGVPVLIPDAKYPNEYRTSSIIQIDQSTVRVGRAAEECRTQHAVVHFKGGVGPHYNDATVSPVRPWRAEALCALLLRKQWRDQQATRQALESVVLAVPAGFTAAQRQALEYAARLAELPAVHLVDEAVAAAEFYLVADDRPVLVYDFGGAGFHATVVHRRQNQTCIVASEQLSGRGGQWLDARIVELLAPAYARPTQSEMPRSLEMKQVQVHRLAEAAKLALSEGPGRLFRRSALIDGKPLEFMLSKGQLDRLAQPLVEQTLDACERCLSASSLQWNQLDRILLVGGSSQLPQVRQRLLQRSGKKPREIHSQDPLGAVAYGAALIAQARARSGVAVTSVGAPADLGVLSRRPGADNYRFELLIARDSPLPATGTRTFHTTRWGQPVMAFFIAQRSEPGAEAVRLGTLEFTLPEAPVGYPVELTLSCSRDGKVEATVRDPGTGKVLRREFLGDPDIAARLRFEKELEQVKAVQFWP